MNKAYIVLIASSFLFSCRITPPPKIITPSSNIEVPESNISLPLRISSNELVHALYSEIENPVVDDTSGELDVTLLATEQITTDQLVETLISPYKPGYWEEGFKETTRTVKRAFKCLLSPWDWGDCYKDVVETVLVPYKFYVEPVEAVYAYVSQPVTELIDLVYPITGWINYRVDLTSLDVSFSGNQLEAIGHFDINLQLDYQQPAIPFGPNIKIKGLLNGDAKALVRLKADISILENAQLQIDIVDDAEIEFTEVFIPSAVEALDVASILSPSILGWKALLGELVNGKLTDLINEELEDEEESLNFYDDIQSIALKSAEGIVLDDNIWLVPNISEIRFGSLNGTNVGNQNILEIPVGLKANPIVTYSSEKPSTRLPDEPIKIGVGDISPVSNLATELSVPYSEVSEIIHELLTEVVEEHYYLEDCKIGEVEVYASDDRAVIAIDLLRRKSERKVVTLYLWGVPKYNEVEKAFRFENVDYTLETRNWLIRGADWLLEDRILDALREESVFKIGEELLEIDKSIKSFEHGNEFFVVRGGFSPLNISDPYLTETSIAVDVRSSGTVLLDVLSPSPEKEEEIVEPTHSYMFDPEVLEKILEDQLQTRKPPFVKFGDTIYYEDENGETQNRIAGLSDVTVPGDSVLVEDATGTLHSFELINEKISGILGAVEEFSVMVVSEDELDADLPPSIEEITIPVDNILIESFNEAVIENRQ